MAIIDLTWLETVPSENISETQHYCGKWKHWINAAKTTLEEGCVLLGIVLNFSKFSNISETTEVSFFWCTQVAYFLLAKEESPRLKLFF